MTVIQTVAGGAGGSGQVIDATISLYDASSSYSLGNSACILFFQSSDMAYPEISIDGRILKTVNAYAQARTASMGYVYKSITNSIIESIKNGLQNLLPNLPDGQYIIVTTGCGSVLSNGLGRTTYWTLDISGGVYTLTFSGTVLMFYHGNQAYVRLLSIAKKS